MKVKSYYGANIKEALDKARKELGPEAAIVASRQVRPDEGLPAAYEVICGMPAEAEAPKAPPKAAPQPAPQQRAPEPDRPGQQKAPEPRKNTTRGISRLRRAITPATPVDEFQSERLRGGLLADGFGEDLTAEIIAGVRQRQRAAAGRGSAPMSPEAALTDELASRIRVAPEIGRRNSSRRIVALVGPPGAGKTTTLVKMAVRYGLLQGKQMHLISTDAYRIGGADALRSYASAMSASFDAIETAPRLSESLDQHAGKDLILIDTQGLGPAEMNAATPLANLLSRHAEIDVHLVLPASMSGSALTTIVARYRPFLPSKILITGVDAVPSYRAHVAQAVLTDKPVSFIGTGQVIPEDLEEATVDRLLGLGQFAAKREAISAA